MTRRTLAAALFLTGAAMTVDPIAAFSPINSAFRGKQTFHSSKTFRPASQLDMSKEDFSTKRNLGTRKYTTNPTPVAVQFWKEHSSELQKAAAGAFLAGSLLLLPLQAADAAMSGGRMGGSFSAPRSSQTRVMPSRSSYGGGGGGYYGGGYSRRPNVIVAPTMPITPFYSPFYSPFGYGGAAAVGYGGGGFGLFNLMFLGFGAFALLNIASAITEPIARSSEGLFNGPETSILGSGTSVATMSVALSVPNRDDLNSILSALTRLSQTARTDKRVGIQNLTSQVAVELLRRKSSITAVHTDVKHFGSREKAAREFNKRSIQERSKFEQETVSKYGGVDYSVASNRVLPRDDTTNGATMAVVTLVLGIDGDSLRPDLQGVSSISQVEEALRKIAMDSKADECLQSVEILWTPEDRTETLSERDIVADYPELRAV